MSETEMTHNNNQITVQVIVVHCSSNLNHFQLAYKCPSSLKGKSSVEIGCIFRTAEVTGSFRLYFFAISSASENTFCKQAYSKVNTPMGAMNRSHMELLRKKGITSLFDIKRPGSLSSSAILQARII